MPNLTSIFDAGRGLFDTLYPPVCEGCGRRVDASELPLCSACIADLDSPDPGDILSRMNQLPGIHVLDRIHAVWFFDAGGTVQKLQHLIKYGNRPTYGQFAGRVIAQSILRDYPEAAYDVIVPIPLHAHRLLERGYNQSTMLARGIRDVLGSQVDEKSLVRCRSTRSQTNLSRSERWENVKEAFHVTRPAEIRGKSCLIVDDVLTTGSTVTSAAQSLRAADAGFIAVAVLAIVDKY